MLKWTLVLLFSIPCVITHGQGIPLLTNITPEEYNNHRQNWAISQMTTGSIFFGNSGGILNFDGVKWLLAHSPNDRTVFSLFFDKDSIYWGGIGDFGVIHSDSLNRFYTESLLKYTESDYHNFTSIWQIMEFQNSIYYRTNEGLYILASDTVHVFPQEKRLTGIIKFGDRLILNNSGRGLVYFNDGDLYEIDGSEIYTDDVIYAALPLNNDILFISRRNGFMRFNGKQFKPFETEAAGYIEENLIYRAARINDSMIALATLRGGIVIIDENGKIRQLITENEGLPTNIIYDLYLDREETLWAATDNGIVKLLVNNPLTVWNETTGYSGNTLFVGEFGEMFYAGSTEGLYYTGPDKKILKNNEVKGRAFSGLKTSEGLLVSTSDGLFLVNNEQFRQVSSQYYTYLSEESVHPDLFYGVSGQRIDLLQLQQDGIEINSFKQMDVHVRHLFTEPELIWIAGADNRVYTVMRDGTLNERYDIPVSETGRLHRIGRLAGQVRLATSEGLFIYNERENLFEQDTTFNDPEMITEDVFRFEECSSTEIWFQNARKAKRAIREDGAWKMIVDPYRTIGRNEGIETIRCNDDGSVWFGGSRFLYHLADPDWRYDHHFNTNITGVFAKDDSLIYGGFGEPKQIPELKYEDNNLRFTYAAASFINPDANSYRVRLRGHEDEWSNWTEETQKDYTFIREGTYTFEVQGRNVYHKTGSIASYTFSILPPWYRTIWAYLLYFGIIAGILYTAHNIRIRQILKIQNIRNRIAGDLHDEVSATLSSISYFAQAVKKGAGGDPERFVSLISESADDAKEKITDIIWAVNPEHDDWQMLIAKCQRFASDLLESSDIRHHIEIEGQIKGKPDIEVRQHFWLIFKEMVTNAVRHSGATQVNITLKKKGNELLLVVQDNGNGFDPETVKQGNGLNNIHKRAKQINAGTELKTEPGFGTRWKLSLYI